MRSLEAALDVALIVMENGGSTPMAERAFRNVLRGFGQEGVPTTWWRLDMVTVSGVAEGRPFTVLRPVGPIGVNLVRASEAAVLAECLARGEVTPDALGPGIERIRGLSNPYNRWITIAAAGFTSAFISQLLGRGWGALAITFVAACVGQFVRAPLRARKISVAPTTLICAATSACLAGIGLRLGLSQTVPSTLIASVFYLVPGLPLINGFVDAIMYKHLLVGLERIVQAMYVFMILATAVALAYTFAM